MYGLGYGSMKSVPQAYILRTFMSEKILALLVEFITHVIDESIHPEFLFHLN